MNNIRIQIQHRKRLSLCFFKRQLVLITKNILKQEKEEARFSLSTISKKFKQQKGLVAWIKAGISDPLVS